MQVEMSYEGDHDLAAYLLREAQSIIDLADEKENDFYPNLQLVSNIKEKSSH